VTRRAWRWRAGRMRAATCSRLLQMIANPRCAAPLRPTPPRARRCSSGWPATSRRACAWRLRATMPARAGFSPVSPPIGKSKCARRSRVTPVRLRTSSPRWPWMKTTTFAAPLRLMRAPRPMCSRRLPATRRIVSAASSRRTSTRRRKPSCSWRTIRRTASSGRLPAMRTCPSTCSTSSRRAITRTSAGRRRSTRPPRRRFSRSSPRTKCPRSARALP